jgi:spermidine/putrescine transport system permease protein
VILARRAGGPRDARSADPSGARSADPRRRTFWALALPPAIALALFLVAPVVFMGALSFRDDLSGTLLGPFEPTLRHYAKLFDTPSFLRSLGISSLTALGVAAAATILAYPLAYYLAFRAGRRAALYLILLLVPFWTSYLLRVMAWKLMLGGEGVINSALIWLGVVTEPISALLYNRGAVIVTLIYVWIPFAALPILAALGRVDVRLHDAAADLYASPLQQFRRVTLPLSLPGVFAAFLMVFIPTVGEYVTPLLVGGTSGSMYGNIVQYFFTRAANWPYGSALAMVMFAATLVLVAIGLRVVNPRRLLER